MTESGTDKLLNKANFKYNPTRPQSILEDSGADVTELIRTSEQVKAERNPIPFKNTPYENSPQKWDTSPSLSYRSPTLSLTHHLILKTSKSLLNNEAQQLTLQKNSRKFFFLFPRLRPKQWLVNDKREGKIKEGYEEIRPSPAGSNTIA